jgi:hypothetical protein
MARLHFEDVPVAAVDVTRDARSRSTFLRNVPHRTAPPSVTRAGRDRLPAYA